MDKNQILNEVNRLVSIGFRKSAINIIEEFLEKTPDEPKILQALGRIYLLEKQPEKAVKYLQLSLKQQQTHNKTPIDNTYVIDNLDDEDTQYIDQNAESSENIYKPDTRSVLHTQSTNIEIQEASENVDSTFNSSEDLSRHNTNPLEEITKDSESSIKIDTKSDDSDNEDDRPNKLLTESESDNFIYQKPGPNALSESDSPTEEDVDDFDDIPPNHENNNTQLDLFDDEILVDDFIDDILENEEDSSELIDEIYSDDQEEKLFSWDDVDEFDDIDDEEKLPEYHTPNIETNGKLSQWERAKQIAVGVIKEYDWDKENLSLLQQVFYENGWAAARYSIERELSKGLTPNELTLALYIRWLWTESEQYWISFIHVKSNQTGQWTRAAYKNMSWPESLRIIRSFNSPPSEEEIQYFIDEIYDNWICSAHLQRHFKSFIRYLKFRTGSVRGSLPGKELFSFTSPYEEELFLDLNYDNIKLARHPRYISPWDIHVQRFTPLGRINRGPQYVLRPASTPHKSRSVKTYLTDLTAFREKIFASLACYRTRRIGKFPCGLLRTKNHHFALRSVSLIFSA